jgi:hypothetical protein
MLLEQEQEQGREREHEGDLEQDPLLIPDKLPVLNEEDWPLCMALSFFFLK